MSRHEIPAHQPDQQVTVGWDNPLLTFFAIVVRSASEPEEDDEILTWLGDTDHAYPTPESLITPLTPFAKLTPEMISHLKSDRLAAIDRGPTPLQRLRFTE